MKPRKYQTYVVEHPSGEWEAIKLPTFFDARDLGKKLQHTDIWLKLPKGYKVWIISNGQIEGPCWVHWNREAGEFDHYSEIDPVPISATSYSKASCPRLQATCLPLSR